MKARQFDFDPGVSLGVAINTIEAALDDEGLKLSARGARLDKVTSVIKDGRKLVLVPASRVSVKEDA